MTAASRFAALVLGAASLVAALPPAAEARREIITPAGRSCYVISSSHHGLSPASVLVQAQRDLVIAVDNVRRERGWKRVRVRARRVTPNPTLRSQVTRSILIKPDVRTRTSYSQCWPGVIWPYVCTSGARVCRR